MKRKIKTFDIILHIFFILVTCCFVLPLVVTISASFTSESYLVGGGGFSLIPHEFTTIAYEKAFRNGERMFRAYGVTIAQSFLGTLIACVVSGMAAYSLSKNDFKYRKMVTVVIFFTMFFSAGMIPTYIIYSKYYGISNNFWVYILPGLTGGAWNTMVFRTFFKGIPDSLFESARIDGASELRIFYQIAVPLSKPVFASIGFMTLVAKWNNYTTSMIYIRDEKLYTLQYLLQRTMQEAEFLQRLAKMGDAGITENMLSEMPSETLKFALCIIAAGPMLMIFPFFQKYFAQGLTVGAVKG